VIKAFLLKFRDPAPINRIRGAIALSLRPRVLILERWLSSPGETFYRHPLKLTIDRDADDRAIARAVDEALGGFGEVNPYRFEVVAP